MTSKSSKRFQTANKTVEVGKVHSISEGIKLAKDSATEKFDSSIEMHIRLNIDPKKTEQKIQTQVQLPHGTGKKLRVAAFVTEQNEKEAKEAGADIVGGEELVKEIKATKKTDFDVAVAEAKVMKNLASIAKILGTRGLMPSPKTGTVGEDVAKMIKESKSGKVDIKTDDSGNIHLSIGKASFDADNLAKNFEAVKQAILKAKPESIKKEFIKSITLAASMGPGIKIG